MKAPFSPYLKKITPALERIIEELSAEYDYVSALSTDSVGLALRISKHSKSLSDSNMTTERGTVIRVHKNGLYSEVAFNEFDCNVESTVSIIKKELEEQFAIIEATKTEIYNTGIIPDPALELFVEKKAEELPENADLDKLISYMTRICDEGFSSTEGVIDCMVNGISTHISKLFLTKNRKLKQSYVYTEGNVILIAPSKDGDIKMAYCPISGCGGLELLRGLKEQVKEAPSIMKDLQNSEKIIPGEYDIISDPGITGLIAHEAFGHGVEMDMFVKKRALGADYIDKKVGSNLVTMHEGALCHESVTAYAFDDEGTLAGDVTEIENGFLRAGICDALAALRLGTQPTGNGKRENFSHKVYTRMTNTVFDSGSDTLDEMIASIDYGYLLKGTDSGMEDPKHWGIQCIISRGYEIKDGRLTGKVVSPIVMTGYVPDLLSSISMVSGDREISGSGACGKGHKEWVKVADGGPYLKMKARLG